MENGERISFGTRDRGHRESNDAGDNSIGEGRTRDSQTAFMDGNGPISHYMRFLPYNEVFCPVEAGAIVGLFSRTKQRKHLLFLMSLQHRLSQVIGRYRRDSHGKHSRVKDLQTTIPLLVCRPKLEHSLLQSETELYLSTTMSHEGTGRAEHFLSAYAIDLSRMKLPLHQCLCSMESMVQSTNYSSHSCNGYRKSGFSSLES